MARLVPALITTGAALAVGAGLIAAGCGRSRTQARAPEADAASNQAGDAGLPSGTSAGGAGGDSAAGGRGGQLAAGGSSGLTAGGSGGKLEPGTSAQWNCDGAFNGCKGTATGPYSQNGAGLVLTRDCVVEPNRPRSQADCDSGQQLNCDLAIDASGAQLLVNCECRPDAGSARLCGTCTSRSSGDEVPAECVGGVRICSCVHIGIH